MSVYLSQLPNGYHIGKILGSIATEAYVVTSIELTDSAIRIRCHRMGLGAYTEMVDLFDTETSCKVEAVQ